MCPRRAGGRRQIRDLLKYEASHPLVYDSGIPKLQDYVLRQTTNQDLIEQAFSENKLPISVYTRTNNPEIQAYLFTITASRESRFNVELFPKIPPHIGDEFLQLIAEGKYEEERLNQEISGEHLLNAAEDLYTRDPMQILSMRSWLDAHPEAVERNPILQMIETQIDETAKGYTPAGEEVVL